MPASSTLSPLLTWLVTEQQLTEVVTLIDATILHLTSRGAASASLHKWLGEFPSPVVEVWPLLFPPTPAPLKVPASDLIIQLRALKRWLAGLPIATLALAFQPTSEQVQGYSATVRAHLGETLLLNITIDETLIGGCQLSYQGQRFSSTLKDRLERV